MNLAANKKLKRTCLAVLLTTVIVGCGRTGQHVSKNTNGNPDVSNPKINQAWTMGIGGDTLLCRRVERDTLNSNDFTYAFGDMPAFMTKLDLFFCNLECQIADVGRKMDKGEVKPFYFRAKPEMVRALVDSGIDIVTIANNHGMDYGPEALLQTIELCRKNGIVIVGGGRNSAEAAAPGFVEAVGLRIGFVGFHSTYTMMSAGPDTAGVNAARYQESDHFLSAVRVALIKARKEADVVVFTVHWGPNYRREPTNKQRRIARQILDMGYDVFIAHSAHQFLGVEIHNGKPIIHDAGNFVVDFYPVEPYWNDRNMMFVLHFKGTQVQYVEAVPIYRTGTVTNFATVDIAETICDRFGSMCAALDTEFKKTEDNKILISVK
ncbi:MAG: CapA family protein [Planctomycetes bacterium]|nr:CapA family protein [Planctomycetota bacterium]